jgi:hypothetical protein
VTVDAKPHPVDVVHLEDLGHALHLAMASTASIGAECLDVPLMREMGMPGQVVNPNPFNGLLLIPGLTQLPDLCLIGTITAPDHQMTSHTGLNRRDAGLGRDRDRIVAVLTLDLVLPCVNVVTEENGLSGPPELAGIGSRNHRSLERVGDGSSLLRVRGGIAERKDRSHASGRHATDDECQLPHYQLTGKEPGPPSAKRAPEVLVPAVDYTTREGC